jgi:hypothetical protein
MVAALVIAASLLGWLAIFVWALSGPRLGRVRSSRSVSSRGARAFPATVMALVAGQSAADQFKVALLELAKRGWFRLTSSGSGPRAVCVIPVEAPVEELTPYEDSAVRHLAKRVGTHTQIPADALADGFDGGEDHFLKSFRKSVIDQSRTHGLTRPTISLRRKVMLCLLALVPAAAPLLLLIGDHRIDRGLPALCVFYYLTLCVIVALVSSERLTTYGHDMLVTWHDASYTADDATTAALGRSVAVLAPFSAPGKNRVWSGYGEDWRLLAVGNPAQRMWPGLSVGAFRVLVVLAIPGIPVLVLAAGLAGLGAQWGLLAGLALELAVFIKASAPWLRLPTRAEFEGQVLRQWKVSEGDDETPSSCCVAIDDGAGQQAWALIVTGQDPSSLLPGTLVRATVNPRLNKVISLQPFRPPARAAHLLDPTPDPRAGTGF